LVCTFFACACGGRLLTTSSDDGVAGPVDASGHTADREASPNEAAPPASQALDGASDSEPAAADASTDVLANCGVGGDVIFVDGDPGEITHVGPLLLGPDAGSWYGASAGLGLQVTLQPTDTTNGDSWTVMLSSQALGVPLTAQQYNDVQMAGSESPGHAGMYVQGGWEECDQISGWFRIEQVVTTADPSAPESSTLQTLTATFEQHCNGETPALHGCVHFQQH
jgi:hypothetical protein